MNAADYDEDVLDIFSKLLPRFVVMSDQNIKVKEQIDICVLYEEVDEGIVSTLIDKTKHNYPQGLKNYKINFIKAAYSNLSLCKNSELLFLLNTSEKHINDTLSYAKKQKSITASYDASLLAEGIEVSLFLGRKTQPYINIGALRKNGTVIDPILLRISKLYMEMDK